MHSNKSATHFHTNAIHIAESPNLSGFTSSDVVAPIHFSSTFAKLDFENTILGHGYSRLSNPTREVMECKLNRLENALHTICYASGQAAESAVVLSFLKSGDEILCFDDIYGGTRRLLAGVFANFGIKTHFVDMRDIKNVKKAYNKNVKMIWAESPTNPFLTLCDIESLANFARENDILSVIDNTFATPYIQRPLDLGIDIVVHSMTKYINGHSDSIAGAVCLGSSILDSKNFPDFENLYEKLRMVSNSTGMILSPMDSYLNIRGIKTLGVRMERHCENAMQVATFLESHPKIERVLYPGLESFPQHELAKKQMKGLGGRNLSGRNLSGEQNLFGGMVAVYIKADYEGMKRFAKNLDIFTLAESLGGVESLYGSPYFMSHGSVDAKIKEQMNITPNLLRLSIGLEHIDDLKDALDRALMVIP